MKPGRAHSRRTKSNVSKPFRDEKHDSWSNSVASSRDCSIQLFEPSRPCKPVARLCTPPLRPCSISPYACFSSESTRRFRERVPHLDHRSLQSSDASKCGHLQGQRGENTRAFVIKCLVAADARFGTRISGIALLAAAT